MNFVADKAETLRYLGHRGQALSDELSEIIDSCIYECEQTCRPRFIYERYDIIHEDNKIYLKDSSLVLVGDNIKKYLSSSEKIILLAATLGYESDKLIKKYAVADMTRSIVIDAVASSLIENVCDQCEREIKSKHSAKSRFSPGYGDFPLETQRLLLNLLDAERKIGLYCNDANILIPQKSVTAIIALCEDELDSEDVGRCGACNMKSDCEFKEDAYS